jgi:hypothetical protein
MLSPGLSFPSPPKIATTLTKLKRAIEVLTAYLTKRNLQHESIKAVTRDHVKAA